jgi:hypothetical protein
MDKTNSSIVLEFVNSVFLDYSPHYQTIKKIAQRDVGQELIDEIDKLLEERKALKKLPEFKKLKFEDASTVSDSNINGIMDAFVKIRSEKPLSNIEKQSIDDLLILFNQWVILGQCHFDQPIQEDIFSQVIAKQSSPGNLEEQLEFVTPLPIETNASYNLLTQSREVYSTVVPSSVYEGLTDQGEFRMVDDSVQNVYTDRKPVYKAQKQGL